MTLKNFLPLLVSAAFFVPAQIQAAPMTLSVHDADLRATIMLVAKTGGLNVSIDDSVKGKVSISLANVEPFQVLQVLAKTKNLQMFQEAGVFIVSADLKPVVLMQSYVFPIRYGDATILKEAVIMSLDPDTERLPNQTTRVRNADGSYTYRYTWNDDDSSGGSDYSENLKRADRVFVNPEVNALILFGTPAEYERVKNLLATLDVELKQVSVEAKILAIDKEATKNLGIDWIWSSIPQNSSTRNNNMRDTDAYGLVQFGRAFGNVRNEWYFSAQINALVTDGKAQILSRPNVTTIQGREALIEIGQSVPVLESKITDSTVINSTEQEFAGIILKYTPRINADGTITAQIHTEVSTPQYVADLKAYQFYKRSADTTVTVHDGEPMIIGGLIGAEEAKSVRKIPFLGDLPILGALFRSHRKSKSESELIILLTAHVLDGANNDTLPDKP